MGANRRIYKCCFWLAGVSFVLLIGFEILLCFLCECREFPFLTNFLWAIFGSSVLSGIIAKIVYNKETTDAMLRALVVIENEIKSHYQFFHYTFSRIFMVKKLS